MFDNTAAWLLWWLTIAIIVGCLLSLTGCDPASGPYSCIPPKQYDHVPVGSWTVRPIPAQDLISFCGQSKGCTVDTQTFIRNDLNATWTACVIRHERGHRNGWPGTHPPY